VPYLTNETIFSLPALPQHLVIVGAGAIGVEMAQAHRRLGCKVTVLEQATMLPQEDPELVAHLRRDVVAEGVLLHEGAAIASIAAAREGVAVKLAGGGARRVVRGSHLLVATGRKPEISGLALERAGVAYTARGITVDRHLCTTNPGIYAIGDVIGSAQLSHLAVHHGVVAFANAVHGAAAEVANHAVPRVVYTDPELAQVGLTEAQARERHGDVRVLRRAYERNDRAVAERATSGGVKVIADARGRILGAGIVGAHAGEVIQKWALAIRCGLDMQAMASIIAPYPTFGYSDRRVAESFAGPVPMIEYWSRAPGRSAAARRTRRHDLPAADSG
jgi:pyruvate/2-oxoglutarate dehydrogenase complex dihydrolipoamide dehydrogenase (E3) component